MSKEILRYFVLEMLLQGFDELPEEKEVDFYLLFRLVYLQVLKELGENLSSEFPGISIATNGYAFSVTINGPDDGLKDLLYRNDVRFIEIQFDEYHIFNIPISAPF